MLKKLVLTILFFAVLTGPARGETVDEVLALYTEGRFTEAMEKGRALGTVDGLNLAVRSQFILIQYTYDPKLRRSVIERAMVDARKAYDMDPDNLEATTNLGIIIALRGKYERSISDGRESRDLFRKAVEMGPEDSWALGALASWHADIIDQAGFIIGRLIFGAKKKKAYEFFDRAIKAEPGNLTIRAAYVRALLKLKPKKFAVIIQENMDYILKSQADNVLESLMKEQIRQIRIAMDNNDQERLELLLDEAVSLELVPDN